MGGEKREILDMGERDVWGGGGVGGITFNWITAKAIAVGCLLLPSTLHLFQMSVRCSGRGLFNCFKPGESVMLPDL